MIAFESPAGVCKTKTCQMNRLLIIITFYGDVTSRANIPINVPNFLLSIIKGHMNTMSGQSTRDCRHLVSRRKSEPLLIRIICFKCGHWWKHNCFHSPVYPLILNISFWFRDGDLKIRRCSAWLYLYNLAKHTF